MVLHRARVRTRRPEDRVPGKVRSYHVLSAEVRDHGGESAQGVEEEPRRAHLTKGLIQKPKKFSTVGSEGLRPGGHHDT